MCAVLVRSARHWIVARDYAAGGPTQDAVRQVLAEVRTHYPRAIIDAYVPAELHDAMQRIALVPSLRVERLTPWRGEHIAIARGALADPLRTELRGRRLLTVAKDASLTLNALAAGYKYPVGATGKQAHEPENGLSRLVAEALETAYAVLSRGFDDEAREGHYAVNPQGARYMTALPQRR